MMYKTLFNLSKNYYFYKARRDKFDTGKTIPFRISPSPFYISETEASAIFRIGKLISSYFCSIFSLYQLNPEVRNLLDQGKPSCFTDITQMPQYLFLRPDLIYTERGFSICEIETSLFGLGISAFLDKAYEQAGFSLLASSATLRQNISQNTPHTGTIVYTNKTQAYAGQLSYLAKHIFSDNKRTWTAQHIESPRNGIIYRAFYLSEYNTDEKVKELIDTHNPMQFIPSLTPFMEEKLLLSFIWDKRYLHHFEKEMGLLEAHELQSYIPITWIVGQEKYCLFDNAQSLEELAKISRSQRMFVVKISGFDIQSSWSEGVFFLNKMSKKHILDLNEKFNKIPIVNLLFKHFILGKNA